VTTATAPAKAPPRPAASPTPAAEPAAPAQQEGGLSGWLGRHPFALRRLHSLMGLLFGGYLVVHLLVNATLLEGARYDGEPTVYQLQVDKIHALPFLELVAWTVILLPIIYHTVYGIVIMAGGRPNVSSYGYGRNWAYLLQRVSAIVLVLFIAFHYLSMKGAFGGSLGQMLTFVPVDSPRTPFSEATQSTVNHFHAAWWIWLVYPLGILSATFHTANGFWTAGVTWGLTVTARAQRLWMFACWALFLFLTACGFLAFGAAMAGEPTDEPIAGQVVIDPRVGEKTPDAQAAEELGAGQPGVVNE
jgi:succinate dehydrogenase / fumarate reductase cytochrome b subunit